MELNSFESAIYLWTQSNNSLQLGPLPASLNTD